MAFLEVKNIYKSFGDTQVLHGVSFDMEKGERRIKILSGNAKEFKLRSVFDAICRKG